MVIFFWLSKKGYNMFLQTAITSPPEADAVQQILGGVQHGNWKLVAAAAVILLVFLIRRFGSKLIPALARGKVAWVVAVVTGITFAFASQLSTGLPVGGFAGAVEIIANGAVTGLAGAGLYDGRAWIATFFPPKTNTPISPPTPPSA